jgi:hypothetical protein
MARHYILNFRDFPMPKLRDDAYYGDYMQQARSELERARYAFDDKTGIEYESGRWVSRYSNPSDYNAADYATREDIFEWVFSGAIKSRAARLANLAKDHRHAA